MYNVYVGGKKIISQHNLCWARDIWSGEIPVFCITSDVIHLSIIFVYSTNNLFIRRKCLPSKPIFEVMKQEKSYTKPNLENRVGEEVTWNQTRTLLPLQRPMCETVHCTGERALFCALILVASLSIYHLNAPITLYNKGQSVFYPFQIVNHDVTL